jgi:hypothetical protein
MPDIKTQKLLYHLTAIDNVASILQDGLKPRAQLKSFADVANPEIIQNRAAHGLENYVPFHWFARNPFDGRVQQDHPKKTFVLFTVRRSLAQAENWTVIPRHPLANGVPERLGYVQGLQAIDWDTMNRRDYHESDCKSVCMAECLSPRLVRAVDFFKIYVPHEAAEKKVREIIAGLKLALEVDINPGMFC